LIDWLTVSRLVPCCCPVQTLVGRGCGYIDGNSDLGCKSAYFAGTTSTMCYCDTDKCNAAPMTSSLGHVTVAAVALFVNVIAARLL